jgi:hypothetical protein
MLGCRYVGPTGEVPAPRKAGRNGGTVLSAPDMIGERPTAPDLYVGYEIARSVRPIVLGRIGFTKTQFVTGRVWFDSVAKKDRAA